MGFNVNAKAFTEMNLPLGRYNESREQSENINNEVLTAFTLLVPNL